MRTFSVFVYKSVPSSGSSEMTRNQSVVSDGVLERVIGIVSRRLIVPIKLILISTVVVWQWL